MCINNWTVNTGAQIVANNKLQKSKEIYCCNKLVELLELVEKTKKIRLLILIEYILIKMYY